MLNSVCAVIDNYRYVWGVSVFMLISMCAVIDNYRCVWGVSVSMLISVCASFCVPQVQCPFSCGGEKKRKLLVKFACVSLDRTGFLLKRTALSQICMMFSQAVFVLTVGGLDGGFGEG